MDDGNKNTVYSGLPKGGMSGKMQSGKGGIGSNNPTPYGSKPSFGTGKDGHFSQKGGRTFSAGTKGKKG